MTSLKAKTARLRERASRAERSAGSGAAAQRCWRWIQGRLNLAMPLRAHSVCVRRARLELATVSDSSQSPADAAVRFLVAVDQVPGIVGLGVGEGYCCRAKVQWHARG
jgi:hypothetical protein